MDNKLSELSKPVGFVSDRASTQLKEGDPASIRPFFDVQGSSPLYSQEYVSALLAELDKAQRANHSAPAILRQLAEEKQKRGEVAAATAFNYAASALQKDLSK
ncbi:TPA: hypothetical protein SMI07_001859 [Serratia liquefaciens]|nr:hypothetical protein [Serratia liquefaciens]